MEQKYEQKRTRLDLSGVLLTALLGVAMCVLNLLLTASFAFFLSYQNASDTQRILKGLKVDGVDVSSAFTFKCNNSCSDTGFACIVVLVLQVYIILCVKGDWDLF